MKRKFKNRLKNSARKTPPAKRLNPEETVLRYAAECVRGATLTEVYYRLILEEHVEWQQLVELVKRNSDSVYPMRLDRVRPNPDELYKALKDELSPRASKLIDEWKIACEQINSGRAVDENSAAFYLGVAWGRQLKAIEIA